MGEIGKATDSSTTADAVGSYYFKLLDEKQLQKHGLPPVAIRAAVAANSNTPASILDALATDPDRLVRLAVATNLSTPTAILEKLALDDELPVAFRLKELDVSVDILVALMQNRNPYIRKQAELTWIGREFEAALEESCQGCVPGDSYKLGELLVQSKLVEEAAIAEALVDSRLYALPLGRALLQTDVVTAEVLLKALRLQTLIREEQIGIDEAIKELVKA
ncbi:hypothetical protein KBI23_25750 [bacterium]|nr:hypothetical protein [bacterium]MBP9806746.1 hypothetical protein [bacterium]